MKNKTNKATNQNKNIKKDDKKEKLEEKKNQENKNVLDENDKKKKREAAAVKMLKCEFCQNPIPDSKKTLNFSCQHQLCGVCISHCIFRDNFKCITERNDLVTLRCNECLKRKSLEVGSAQVQISFILTLLKDTYKIRNKKKRDICLNHKKEADYCPICKKWICEECKKQFHNTNFPSHSFFTTEEPFSFKRCRKHGDKGLELFCDDCGVDICSSCALKGGDHSSHNVISMVDLKKRILKGKKKYKYQNMDEFDDVLQKLQIEFKNRFEKSYKQKSELISEITTLLQTFYDQFFAYKEKMENFIENYFKIIRACYFNYFKDIEEKEPRINSLEFIDSVDREISHFDFDSKYTAELEKIKNDLSLIKARKFFEYKLRFIHHSFQCINTMKDTNIEYKKDKKGQKITEIKNQIYCLIQLKNGNVLTGGSKGILNIWDINTGKKVDSFKAHKGNIYSVIELNDGRLASSGGDSWIKIWDIKNEDDTNLEAKTIDLIPKKPIEKELNPVSMEKPSIIIKKDDNESLIKNNNDINTNTNNLINNNWNNKTTVNEINTTNLVQINQDNEKMKLNAHPKNLIVPENENTGYNSNMNMANMINSGLNNQPQIQVSQNPPNVSYAGNGIAFEHPKDVAYGSSGVSQAQNNQLSGQPYYNFNMNDNNIQNLGNSTINQNNISDLASQSFGKNTNSTFPVVNNESNNNKEKINNDNKGLKKKLEEKQNKCINDIDTINKMIEKINEQISSINIERERLKNNINGSIKEEEKEKKEINKGFGDGNVDASNKLSLDAESLDLYLTKYVLKSNYDDFLKVNKEKINKIRDEINKINNQIKEISNTLPNKADVDDLSELRDFLSNKFEELLTEIPKRFSDKNETTKFLKYLEDQIKTLMSISKSKNDSHMPENWLLAAKPISGFSCAACESYIGDLKTEKEKFIAWNKLPTRESGEKLYRMGNGFSKMLSMLNFDSNGNVYLNPNAESNNSEDDDESKCNTKRNKEKSLSTLLIRNKSQNDNLNLFNDHKINSNKLGKRTQNNFFKKEEIKSTYLPKIKKESDIAEIKKENDDNPKITKIFKKSHSKLHLKENN